MDYYVRQFLRELPIDKTVSRQIVSDINKLNTEESYYLKNLMTDFVRSSNSVNSNNDIRNLNFKIILNLISKNSPKCHKYLKDLDLLYTPKNICPEEPKVVIEEPKTNKSFYDKISQMFSDSKSILKYDKLLKDL